MDPKPERRWSLAMIFAPWRKRPALGLGVLGFIAFGMGVGWLAFPEQWHAALRLAGGFVLGLGSALVLFMNRMIATDFED